MARIFLSYKREERDRVRSIVAALEAAGHNVWWDPHLDPRDEAYQLQIKREIDAADVCIVAWSKLSEKSNFVVAEATAALKQKKLVCVLLDHDSDPPPPFNTMQLIDLSDWHGERDHPQWRRVLAAVKEPGLFVGLKQRLSPGQSTDALQSAKKSKSAGLGWIAKFASSLAAVLAIAFAILFSLVWGLGAYVGLTENKERLAHKYEANFPTDWRYVAKIWEWYGGESALPAGVIKIRYDDESYGLFGTEPPNFYPMNSFVEVYGRPLTTARPEDELARDEQISEQFPNRYAVKKDQLWPGVGYRPVFTNPLYRWRWDKVAVECTLEDRTLEYDSTDDLYTNTGVRWGGGVRSGNTKQWVFVDFGGATWSSSKSGPMPADEDGNGSVWEEIKAGTPRFLCFDYVLMYRYSDTPGKFDCRNELDMETLQRRVISHPALKLNYLNGHGNHPSVFAAGYKFPQSLLPGIATISVGSCRQIDFPR